MTVYPDAFLIKVGGRKLERKDLTLTGGSSGK
jgi:hypothetical protein